MQSVLPTQPAYGTPENDLVVQVGQEFFKIVAGALPWPDAAALLRSLEANEAIGWQARWALKLAIERMRTMANTIHGEDFRDYVFRILT